MNSGSGFAVYCAEVQALRVYIGGLRSGSLLSRLQGSKFRDGGLDNDVWLQVVAGWFQVVSGWALLAALG